MEQFRQFNSVSHTLMADGHQAVTFKSEQLKWPIRLVFGKVGLDDSDVSEWFNVAIELGDALDPQQEVRMSQTPRRFDPAFLELVASAYGELEERARAVLNAGLFVDFQPPKVDDSLKAPPRRRRKPTPDHLRQVKAFAKAYEDEGLSPAKAIAADWGIDRATAYRWLAAANKLEDEGAES